LEEVVREGGGCEVFKNDGGDGKGKRATCPEEILACISFKACTIFQKEARLWLSAISRHLSGRRTIRNPFYGEISRDIPYEMFTLLVRLVKSTHEYSPPFCYYANNKKGEVISFTSLRLVVNLLVLLSRYSAQEVGMYFKRTLATGSRRGHKVSIITSDEKDFAFIYKHRQGKLVISFYYGEWNSSGFPQHVE
jgi:hypothetical protein